MNFSFRVNSPAVQAFEKEKSAPGLRQLRVLKRQMFQAFSFNILWWLKIYVLHLENSIIVLYLLASLSQEEGKGVYAVKDRKNRGEADSV